VLHGNLVLKGGGDPKITVERWQAFMAMLRANGLAASTAISSSTERCSRPSRTIRRHSTASRSSRTTSGPTRCSSISNR
jgi:D-alanyl-D-alanine carboxypeptidase